MAQKFRKWILGAGALTAFGLLLSIGNVSRTAPGVVVIALSIVCVLVAIAGFLEWRRGPKYKVSKAAEEALHQVVHSSRDGISEILDLWKQVQQSAENLVSRVKKGELSSQVAQDLLSHDLDKVRTLCLEHKREFAQRLIQLFAKLPPYKRVWVAVRELHEVKKNLNEERAEPKIGPNSERVFLTVIRAGEFDATRPNNTEGISEGASLPREIRDRHNSASRNGVLIVGTPRPQFWPAKLINDGLGEDKCICVAPGFRKSWTNPGVTKDQELELTHILFVNSSEAEVFDESHVQMMKVCADAFSAYINVYLRLDGYKLLAQLKN